MGGRAGSPRQAYAHNDEEQARPLYDALRHGFTAIEADVWAIGDRLLIGHDEPDPGRTLQGLYLDPLGRSSRRMVVPTGSSCSST